MKSLERKLSPLEKKVTRAFPIKSHKTMLKPDATLWSRSTFTHTFNISGISIHFQTFSKAGPSSLTVFYALAFGAVGSQLLAVVPFLGTVFVMAAVCGLVAVFTFVRCPVLFCVQGVFRLYRRGHSDLNWALGASKNLFTSVLLMRSNFV